MESYDTSERGLNSFGYQLIGEGNHAEALQVFELNKQIYSDSYNAFDSYGECLLLMGRKQEGLDAYAKSLEVNPNNDNAKSILAEHK